MSQPVLFVLGYGPNIGHSIATRFATQGYKVAIASRSLPDETINEAGWLQLHVDLSYPGAVPTVFSKVTEKFGIPSVVVYNCAYRNVLPPTDPLSMDALLDVAHLTREFNLNALSGLITAQQAVKGFKQLPSSASRTFIFTANALNEIMIQQVLTFGMAKKAVSYMVEAASMAYREAGFSFYYTDERHSDGSPVLDGWSGPARAELCFKLATEHRGPFQQTFVKGRGYVDFREQDFRERITRMSKWE